MIAQQSNNNCVARAFSTMRLALGYENAVPSDYEIGSKKASDVIDMMADWFPEHKGYIWCSQESADLAQDKSTYAGETFNITEYDFDEYIVGFSYYTTDDKIGHFVVGCPILYEHMNCGIIVAVKM